MQMTANFLTWMERYVWRYRLYLHQFMHHYPPVTMPHHQTPPSAAFCFAPNMLSMSMPETPSSVTSAPAGLPNQGNMSPLAHRGTLRPAPGELSPNPMLVQQQQQKLGHGMPPMPSAMAHSGPSALYPEAPVVRRANSYGAVPPWPAPDNDLFFNMPQPMPQGAPMTPANAAQQQAMMRPIPLQRQYSAPQPRSIRERTERKATTDVWPDDVEVAFWEALRLIPKLGRRKVLVHGKPCGRNELIADYIERKTNKTRSRKQVSSHIQVLKNVKRNDPEFQQLIAEPVTEEDYYTPAGGMMYAQPLAGYSSGLLGVSLLSAPSDTTMVVSPSPLSSATLSPNSGLMSPLPSGHSPRGSPATGAIANALDNMHFTSSPQPMFSPALPAQPSGGTVMLSELDPAPMVLPASFTMWAYATTTEDKHVYAKLDSLSMSQVLQGNTPLPVVPVHSPLLSSFRFPKLEEMFQQLSCPCFHVNVPLSLPRLTQSSPSFDRFSVALSLASSKNTPLTSVLSIYSHSKCVLSMVEPLEPPRPIASRRADSLNMRSPQPSTPSLDGSSATEVSSPTLSDNPRSPTMPASSDRYRWSYQAPFATDFWADFLSRNHPVHMYGNGGLDMVPSFCKEPSERAALGLAVSGVTFVQEFVLPRNAGTSVAHTIQSPPESSGSHVSPGSKAGEVVCVVAWELECVETLAKQPGTPTVSVIKSASSPGPNSRPATPQKSHRLEEPDTPTPGPSAESTTMLGLQLQPPPHPGLQDRNLLRPSTPPVPPTLIRTQASPNVQSSPVKMGNGDRPPPPRLTTTEPSPQAPGQRDVDYGHGNLQAPASAQKLAKAAQQSHMSAASTPRTLENASHPSYLSADDFAPSEQHRHSFSTFSNQTGYASTLLPSMALGSNAGMGASGAGHARHGPLSHSMPIRSNSLSVLEENDSSATLPSAPLGISATVNSLTDPLPSYDGSGDASVRLGASTGQMSWGLQQDFMDAFLNNPTSDTVFVGPGSPSVSPTAMSFSLQDPSVYAPHNDASMITSL